MVISLLKITHRIFRSLITWTWVVIVSFIGIIPPLIKAGFPPNHEDDTFVLRTMVYAKHFRFGDLVPVWSSTDNFGFGSPFPSLYHRLYYLVSGFIYASTNNAKIAISLALIVFTSIGIRFVYLTLRSFHCSQYIAIVGASVLPFLNYSVTNWLVRGAMAEYSAMMLIPVVLYFVKKSWDSKSLHWSLGLTFGFLFLAHSVVAYFVAFLIGILLLTACLFRLLPWSFFALKQAALSLFAFISITWWSLLPMLYFRQRFDVGRLLPNFLSVQLQFHRATEYIWDSSWSWSNAPQLFTLQIDIIILSTLAVLLIMRKFSTEHIWVFALLVVSLLLQNGRSWKLYQLIPGAEYIQFPWRLSALSSVVMLILVFIGLSKFRSVALAVALFTIVISGTWQRVNYYSYPDRLETRNSRSLSNYSLSLFGEYLPTAGSILTPDPSSSNIFSEWRPDLLDFIHINNATASCTVTRNSPIKEIQSVSFTATCDRVSLATLPVFATSAHTISSSRDHVKDHCIVKEDSQSLCVVELPQGTTSLTVHMPTFMSVISALVNP